MPSRAIGALLLAVAITTASCAKFSSDDAPTSADGGVDSATDGAPVPGSDAGACPVERCDGDAAVACWFYDFATCPAAEWTYFSEPSVGSTLSCSGDLHVTAIDTADVTATLDLPTPSVSYSVRFALTLTLSSWDETRVLALGTGASPAFVLTATKGLAASFGLQLCPDTSGSGCVAIPGISFPPGKPHRLVFDVSSKKTVLTVDCAAKTELVKTTTLEKSAGLTFVFGKQDGKALDGTIDDVMVTWAPP